MKRIFSLSILITAVAISIASCSDASVNINTNSIANKTANAANTVANTAANMANTVANAVSSATTSGPEGFMKDAAQGGLAEIELGKLAGTKAQNAEVKKFGQMMVTDHTAIGSDLKALAAKKNFTLPTDVGSHKSTIDKLNGLTGADFDKEYVSDMVSGHESVLADFQKQAANATDPDVKAFAAKQVPIIKKHLDAIKALQAKMSGASNTSKPSNTK